MALPDAGSALQQECDCGMVEEPHICAIRWQHACSCAVMLCPGNTQANRGAVTHRSMTLTKMAAAERRMVRL